jgi:integrase
MLESFIYPDLGSRPIRGITAPDILGALRAIAARGRHETARRTKQKCGQVFRYAIATGRASHDVTADLRGALAPVVSQNHAAITDPVKIGALLRAIDGYSGQIVTGYALRLAPMVFVRPGELRQAEWSEFDLDGATWRIPAAKMKMREEHIVPLAPQALALLRELHTLTGRGRFLFNSLRTSQRPMSENTINAALRRLGYSNEEMTGHGFRALASTCLNEQGWSPDLIELQLAHSDKDRIRAVYNRSKKLPERRRMMLAWADYLDTLRAQQNVVPIRKIA